MTPMPSESHLFGEYMLTLEMTRKGPVIAMGGVDEQVREGLFSGGVVYYRQQEPERRADYVFFFVKDIVDASLLIDVLTNPTAGLLVDETDGAADVATLRGWLRQAIRNGRDWLELVA